MELSDKSVAEIAGELAQMPFFEELRAGSLLKRVPFFKDVDEALLDELASSCILRILHPDQIVCRQGEYGDTFYLILKGRVEVSIGTQEKPYIPIAQIGKNSFFGEHAPLAESARTATVSAVENTILLEIGKKAFLMLREKYPSIKKAIDDVYIDRLLGTQLRRVGLFSTLPDDVIEELKSKVELVEADRGEKIINFGDDADCLYLLRAGFVKVGLGEGEGEKILAYLKDGSYFGEMSLLHGEKRTADVAAVTRCELVKIQAADFQALLDKHPDVKAQLLKTVEERKTSNIETQDDKERSKKMKFAVETGLVQAERILVMDTGICIKCNSCVEACAANHESFPRLERTGQRLGKLLLPTTCMHCTDPECMLCPHGGIYRDKRGEIHHTVQCIHCGGCAKRCPYGNILIINIDDKKTRLFSKRKSKEAAAESGPVKKLRPFEKQRVVKCDMCSDKAFVACVYNCPVGACRVITPQEFMELSTE